MQRVLDIGLPQVIKTPAPMYQHLDTCAVLYFVSFSVVYIAVVTFCQHPSLVGHFFVSFICFPSVTFALQFHACPHVVSILRGSFFVVFSSSFTL